jgi:hypothetical protein
MRTLDTGAANSCERNSTGRPNFLWGVMIGLAVMGLILVVM